MKVREIANVAVVLACLCGVARTGETEVRGNGYAAPQRPPSTTSPPDSWTQETDPHAHDPEEGIEFDDVIDYELKQGAHDDDRRRWRDTDYVHFKVHGATLEAEGQVHDKDARAATIASAEAWGSERIPAQVTEEEGTWGEIRAENRLGFSYDFLITGPRIGEASIQLQGTAYDIKGTPHAFSLSAQSGESVTDSARAEGGIHVNIGMNRKGSMFGVSTGTDGEITTVKRLPASDGETGHSDELLVPDGISGATPLTRTYQVFSEGSVVLRVRTAATGQEASVQLRRFRILNDVRVWTNAWSHPDGPEPGDPGGPGPTTPGGDEPPPPPPDPEPSDGPTTPGSDGSGGGPGGIGDRTLAEPTRSTWEGGSIEVTHRRPHGLAAEPGTLPGLLVVRLGTPAPRDLVLAVAAEPAGSLTLDAEHLRIPEGGRRGSLRFHAEAAGPAAIVAQVLDASGAPSGVVLEHPVDAGSIADWPETGIWATAEGLPWRPGAGVTVRGVAGEDVGPLRLGRLGFAGYFDTATALTVDVHDPQDVLPDLPATIVIPAGETSVALPLRLRDAAGFATIGLEAGAQRVAVHVVSEAQGWGSLPVVRVPLGAVAPVPFLLDRVERTARAVEVLLAGAEHVAFEGPADATVLAGEKAWFVPVRGTALGVTQLHLRTEGLPDLPVAVEVVEPDVSVTPGALRLTGLDGSRAGVIRIAAPADVRFLRLDTPAEVSEALAVEGIGTSVVTLRFTESPDLPASLTLPIELGGAVGVPLYLDVFDTHHEPAAGGARNSYRIRVAD